MKWFLGLKGPARTGAEAGKARTGVNIRIWLTEQPGRAIRFKWTEMHWSP